MLILLFTTAVLAQDCTEFLTQQRCEATDSCVFDKNECISVYHCSSKKHQNSCIDKHCAWDTCSNECDFSALLSADCATQSLTDDYCSMSVLGKPMTKSNCQELVGCAWDQCSDACAELHSIQSDCVLRLGILPVNPMMPGGMYPGSAMYPGYRGYYPGTRGRPLLKYDVETGRRYRPYQRRPLTLDKKVWTWVLALPFICALMFLSGFWFPSDVCGPSEDDSHSTLMPYSQPGEGFMHMQPRDPDENSSYVTSASKASQQKRFAQRSYQPPQRERRSESVERERVYENRRQFSPGSEDHDNSDPYTPFTKSPPAFSKMENV